jgi:VanZ family protein
MMRWWSGRAAMIAFLSTALVSVLDEWHQAHLPGRTGTIQDVLLDSSAAVCAQLFLVAISECQALARDKQLMIPDECFSKLPPA